MRRIGANGFLCWPTARAEDAESCGNHPGATDSLTGAAQHWKTPHGLSGTDRFGKTAGGGGEFAKQVMSWQTPAADSFRSRGGDRKDEQGLDQQARLWHSPNAANCKGTQNPQTAKEQGHAQRLQDQAKFWPTPNANPAPRGVNFTRSDSHYKPHDLMTAVRDWPTPTARDFRTGAGTKRRKGHAPGLCEIASQSSVRGRMKRMLGVSSSTTGRKLNPLFVESLMGLPLGWTACEPLATVLFRSWLRTHSERFDVLSRIEPHG